MWQVVKRPGQDRGLFMQTDVFVNNAMHAPLNDAKATFNRYPAGPKALFRYRHAELFCQIFEVLVYLVRFHGTTLG